MRVLFEPTERFLSKRVRWYNEGETVDGKIIDFLSLLHQHKTIAIHLRLGDTHFSQKRPLDFGSIKIAKTVAKCVEKAVSKFSLSDATNSSVKWIVASDDSSMRRYFKKMHPERAIILDNDPHHAMEFNGHFRTEGSESDDFTYLFAEWLMLSNADHLVTNLAHNFGVSAFSRSAWLYQLKSEYFEVDIYSGSCKKRIYRYQVRLFCLPSCYNALY